MKKSGTTKIIDALKAINTTLCNGGVNGGTSGGDDPTVLTVSNQHQEVLDTSSTTISGVANYSYTVLSGSATVTINGVTLSGLPAGFDARQGDSTPNTLTNDISIIGESLGTRVIIYYETIA